MAEKSSLKVLDHCRISPATAASVLPTSIPLSFFDLIWGPRVVVKSLLFYEFPDLNNNTDDFFLQTIVPTLKHSLSLTLGIFFPFAGHLIRPLPPKKPHLKYVDGDAVPLIVAQSGANFNELVADHPQDARNLHPLVPQLPETVCDEDGTHSIPLVAIQVTLFSKRGFSMCVAFRHIAADGSSAHHFMKTWATLCKNKGDLASLESSSLPVHERDFIKDPKNLEQQFLSQWWKRTAQYEVLNQKPDYHLMDKVRATFSLTRLQIENLKKRLSREYASQAKEPEMLVNFSSFAVVCAFFWVCLVKSEQEQADIDSDDGEVLYHLCFLGDCRTRNFEVSIPETYFGNGAASCFLSVQKKQLLGNEKAVLEAAKAIRNKVLEFVRDPFKDAENWISEFWRRCLSGHQIEIAWSPKFGLYEVDFGWGRPKKSEMVQIDGSVAISLSESRDEAGGIEVGVALGRARMNIFIDIFEKSLKSLCPF